jgi:hypothetical protein
MTGSVPAQSPESLPEFYLDLVGNLAASSRIMVLKLPAFATAATDGELVGIVGQCLTLSIGHRDALEAIVSHLDRPPRLHAAELEDLLGTGAREMSGWRPGTIRDLGLAGLLRTALHLAFPSYELARSLAAELGYESQDHTLSRLRHEVGSIDSHLQRVTQQLVTGRAIGSP